MIHDLLAEVLSLGWYVYTLGDEGPHCTWSTFRWHCCIRHEAGPDSRIARGQGNTPEEALNAAINAIPEASPEEKITFTIDASAPTPAISAVLAKLIRREPIKRRV